MVFDGRIVLLEVIQGLGIRWLHVDEVLAFVRAPWYSSSYLNLILVVYIVGRADGLW
jgi:hypothetical protein